MDFNKKKTYRVPEKDRTRESATASEVMHVMTKNGLGFMLSKMPFTRKRPEDWGRRLRISFEELGPTYRWGR